MGSYWERNREREIFRLNRFPIIEAKSYFCTVLRSNSNVFLQFPLGIVEKQSKKKQAYCWLNWKTKSQANEMWGFEHSFYIARFPRKVPIFRACKNAKFSLQHPIIFGVLASPWTTLKTEKREFAFSWEMKSVSGHPNPPTIMITVFFFFFFFFF